MGMYDLINGEQVKCFPSIYLYKSKISYSYGSLLSLSTGDIIPEQLRQTLFYYYPKNFIILDIFLNETNTKKFCLHLIKDYKIVNTIYSLDELQEFFNMNVYDYFGNFINIKSKEEILSYISDFKKYLKYKDNLIKYYLKNSKKLESRDFRSRLNMLEYDILNKYCNPIPHFKTYQKIGLYLECIYNLNFDELSKNNSVEDLKEFKQEVKTFFKTYCRLKDNFTINSELLKNSILLSYKNSFYIEDKVFFDIFKSLQEFFNS